MFNLKTNYTLFFPFFWVYPNKIHETTYYSAANEQKNDRLKGISENSKPPEWTAPKDDVPQDGIDFLSKNEAARFAAPVFFCRN